LIFSHNGKDIPLAPIQDPNNIDTWGADWSEFLMPQESLAKSKWLLPSDLISIDETCTLTHTSILLEGGIPGKRYIVTNRIKTNLDNTIDRSMIIRCINI